MKILITGGAGFQGSHLVERLHELDHEVSVLNTFTPQAEINRDILKNKAHVIWGSVTDPEITEKAMRDKDMVFHLGARVNVDESIKDPLGTINVNVHGTYNVLEAAHKLGIRVVYTSTCEVYGTPKKIPISEEDELLPRSPYAASKAAADRLCCSYYHTYKLPVTIIRFFNIYGERQKDGKFGALIPILTNQALRGEKIKVFGNGEQTRDYLNISDVMSGYLSVLNHPEFAGEVFNFGTGVGTKIKDIAEYIAQKMNTEVEYITARPGEASDMVADFSKAKKFLGWEPKVSIYEGIDRYLAWRKNRMID